jgi:predicted transcriptional regulator
MARPEDYLSRRFREIMDLVYERGQVTAADLEISLSGNPSNSTIRTQLRTLEDRGHLTHTEEEGRFVYRPAHAKPNAARAAMKRFLQTFVDGSAEQALATLLSAKEAELSEADFERLQVLIDEARRKK